VIPANVTAERNVCVPAENRIPAPPGVFFSGTGSISESGGA
jgi:hypothetical protein